MRHQLNSEASGVIWPWVVLLDIDQNHTKGVLLGDNRYNMIPIVMFNKRSSSLTHAATHVEFVQHGVVHVVDGLGQSAFH